MEERLLDGMAVFTGGCDGPAVSKRSMMELILDCWVVGEAGEVAPPKMSANRSALFWDPLVPLLLVIPAPSPIKSNSKSFSAGLTVFDFRLADLFGFFVASPKTLDSSLICGGGIFSKTPFLIASYANRLPYSTARC